MVRPTFEFVISSAIAAIAFVMMYGQYSGTLVGLAFGGIAGLAFLSMWASGAAIVRESTRYGAIGVDPDE